jgi:hypothetical protein
MTLVVRLQSKRRKPMPPDTRFLRLEGKMNVYDFTCPGCGAGGEIGVPKDSTRLFGHGCGVLFIQTLARDYAEPKLTVVNDPKGAQA